MIFDVEADGLLDEATKIHVLSYTDENGNVKSTHNYQEMIDIITNTKVLIGHNIILYDIPLLEKILGIEIKARLIDTLALSWYLNHSRIKHGLEVYGQEFGVPKPKIDDWENLTPEEYKHRCEEDVKINQELWKKLKHKLLKIYDDKDSANRLINYLTFKMKCVRLQHKSRWKLDVGKAEQMLKELVPQLEEKTNALIKHMPLNPKYEIKKRPKKPFKKDGSWSAVGEKWFALLDKEGLPHTHSEPIKVVSHWEEPKPSSHSQVKSWLFSLGWKPRTFKYDGDRKIPQIRKEVDGIKELCPSVKDLIEDHPEVELLEGITVFQHRISIFEGFLKEQVEGYLIADIGGLTNTLRFKHRVLVNLPGVEKPFGVDIRGSLISEDGKILCGSDMSSLEETTKKHYMYDYDPEYVEEMSKPGFDAHLDLAKQAGAVTQDKIDLWKKDKGNHHDVTLVRKMYKPANYACIYGVQAKRLSQDTGLTIKECQKLIDTYWKRNWAVKALVEDTEVKTVNGEKWLYNPVSKLYYSLRFDKDKFSTLNQGTGVYCFDMWIREFLSKREQLTGQFHDEIIIEIKDGFEDKCEKLLRNAIKSVNDKLKLNVILDIDVQFGKTYAEIH